MPSHLSVEKSTLFELPDLDAIKGNELKPSAFSTVIKYYVLPECNEKVRLNFGVYLMLCGTSSTATVDQWKSWLVTWTCLLTPTIANKLTETQYQSTEISFADIEGLSKKMNELNSTLHSEDTALLVKSATEVGNFIKLQNLPFPNEDADITKVKESFTIRHLYRYYSSKLLLASMKFFRIDMDCRLCQREESIELGLAERAFTDVDFTQPDGSIIQINIAWNELEDFKTKIFIEYSNYNSPESNFLQRIIWKTVRRLQDHDKNHALIIYNYLKSNPSAMENPELRYSILIFMNSFIKTKNIPVRLLLYMNVIFGDDLFSKIELKLLCDRVKVL